MKDALLVYLQDHLAGAVFGVELVEALEHDHAGSDLGDQARAWRIEIEADQVTLRGVVEQLGASPSAIKQVLSWIGEKAMSLKLRRQSDRELATFETLEALALGILGKGKLWRALRSVAANDPRLSGIDFAALEERAQHQHASVEAQRLRFADRVF